LDALLEATEEWGEKQKAYIDQQVEGITRILVGRGASDKLAKGLAETVSAIVEEEISQYLSEST
jgi:hypothetical protein